MAPPKVIVGSGVWGREWPKEDMMRVPQLSKELGIRQVDTAPMYPPESPQAAEKTIGYANLGAPHNYRVDSAVLYSRHGYGGSGDGTMTAEAITRSLEQTLKNVNTEKLNIFYCHGPDEKTPLVEQAAAMDAEFRKGRFSKLGVRNFPIHILEDWLKIADAKGYVKPSIFQGHYNLLCRTYEEKLIPFLRKHNITFYASSPLAGGFLTGKVTLADDPDQLIGTRFENSEANILGKIYRMRYDKPSLHTAVRHMMVLCQEHDMSLAEAATRWILYHSKLDGGRILSDEGDAIIIGPQRLVQLQAYADAYIHGPLPDELAEDLDGFWGSVKQDVTFIHV